MPAKMLTDPPVIRRTAIIAGLLALIAKAIYTGWILAVMLFTGTIVLLPAIPIVAALLITKRGDTVWRQAGTGAILLQDALIVYAYSLLMVLLGASIVDGTIAQGNTSMSLVINLGTLLGLSHTVAQRISADLSVVVAALLVLLTVYFIGRYCWLKWGRAHS